MKNNKREREKISIDHSRKFKIPRNIDLSYGFGTPVNSRERSKEVCLSSPILDRF